MAPIFDSQVFQKLKNLDIYSNQIIDALTRSPAVTNNDASNNLNELKQDILKTNLYVDIPSILPSLVNVIPEYYSKLDRENLTTWIRQILQKVNLASFTHYLLTDNMHAIGRLSLSHLSEGPTSLCRPILFAYIDIRTRMLVDLTLDSYLDPNSHYSSEDGIDMDSLLEQALSLDPLSYGFGSQEYTVPFMEDVKKRREKIFSLDDLDDLNTLMPLDRLKNICESAIIYHNLRTPTISVNKILLEPNTLDNVDIYMQRKSATGIKFKKHNVTDDNNSSVQEARTNDTVIDLQKLNNNKPDTSPVHPTLAKSTEEPSHHITSDDSDTSSIYLSPTEAIQEQPHLNGSDTSSIQPAPSAKKHAIHITSRNSPIHTTSTETTQVQPNQIINTNDKTEIFDSSDNRSNIQGSSGKEVLSTRSSVDSSIDGDNVVDQTDANFVSGRKRSHSSDQIDHPYKRQTISAATGYRTSLPSTSNHTSAETMDSISEDLYSPSALVSQTKRQGIQAAHRRQQAESSTSSALQSSQKSIAEHTSNNTSDQPSDRIGIGISEIKRGWDTNINNENLPDQVGARRHLPTTIRPHRRLHSSPSRSISHRYNIWTDDEFNALKEGLRIFKGKYWIDIKKRFAERLSKRTNVDIRDKARNEARRRHLLGLPMEEFQYAF